MGLAVDMTRAPMNWIRAFAASAATESFAIAARELGVTQPAVSKQIKALEDHLGQKLFSRTPQRVTLTAAGKAFAPIVQDALAAIDRGSLAIFGGREVQTVRLYAHNLFASSWLAERYRQLEEDNPGLSIEVHDHLSPLGGDTASDSVKIFYGDIPPECDLLFNDEIYPVATRDFAKRISEPEDLLQYRLLEVGANRIGWARFLEAVAPHIGGTARFRLVGSTPIALAIAAGGGGIALARGPASDFLLSSYGLVRCLPGSTIMDQKGFYLQAIGRKPATPAAARLRAWLEGQAAEERTRRGR